MARMLLEVNLENKIPDKNTVAFLRLLTLPSSADKINLASAFTVIDSFDTSSNIIYLREGAEHEISGDLIHFKFNGSRFVLPKDCIIFISDLTSGAILWSKKGETK